MSAFKNWMIEV